MADWMCIPSFPLLLYICDQGQNFYKVANRQAMHRTFVYTIPICSPLVGAFSPHATLGLVFCNLAYWVNPDTLWLLYCTISKACQFGN